jgi:hypothetical protein
MKTSLILFSIILSAPGYSAITEKEFHEVGKDFIDFIVPYGKKWNPEYTRSLRLTEEKQFGAYAAEPIIVTRGLIEDPEMTRDGLAMILCHEVGHNVDLARFYLGELDYAFRHLEQDYFASAACFFPYLESLDETQRPKINFNEIPSGLVSRCQSEFPDSIRVSHCLRALEASRVTINGVYRLFSKAGIEKNPPPSFKREWLGTEDIHQARLVNFIRGIFNERPFNNDP